MNNKPQTVRKKSAVTSKNACTSEKERAGDKPKC